MSAVSVTLKGKDPRFVEETPVRDAVAECANGELGVLAEACGEIAIGPAAGFFQFLREVPMIEGTERTNFCFEERVGEALVVIETFRIGRTRAIRLDARPGNRKTIAGEIHRFQQCDVFFVAMVGIASDVAGRSAFNFAGSVREAVPDGFAPAIFGPGPFDLIGGGGGAPDEFFGKLEGRELRLRFK